jgi:hypothetical protein
MKERALTRLISDFDNIVVFEKSQTSEEFFRERDVPAGLQTLILEKSLASLWSRELEVISCL